MSATTGPADGTAETYEQRRVRVRARLEPLGLSHDDLTRFEIKIARGILKEDEGFRLARAVAANEDTSIGSPLWYKLRMRTTRPDGARSYREFRRDLALWSRRTVPASPPCQRQTHRPQTRRQTHGRPAKSNAPPADDSEPEPSTARRFERRRELLPAWYDLLDAVVAGVAKQLEGQVLR